MKILKANFESRAKVLVHKGLIGPEGESGSLCFDPPRAISSDKEAAVFSEWLHDEVSCAKCLKRLGLPRQISRGKLLRDNLEARLEIVFQFVDANYWNKKVRKSHEPKINPDDNAVLAEGFLRLTKEFDDLIQPLKEMMESHIRIYGRGAGLSDDETVH